MQNCLKRLATVLMTLVLAVGMFVPSALAADLNTDEGIAPCGTCCPVCGGTTSVSLTWHEDLVDEYEDFCIHKPHGTDTWKYKVGQSLEHCRSCGWSEVSELRTRVLFKCYGSF